MLVYNRCSIFPANLELLDSNFRHMRIQAITGRITAAGTVFVQRRLRRMFTFWAVQFREYIGAMRKASRPLMAVLRGIPRTARGVSCDAIATPPLYSGA